MKFIVSFVSLLIIFPLASLAVSVSYDTAYDNGSLLLSVVACSYAIESLGFTTLGSLPHFPYIGGVPSVSNYTSKACGSCWELTYTDSVNHTRSIDVLAIDRSVNGINIALGALNNLTGGHGEFLGRVEAQAKEVPSSVCGLKV